MDGAEIGMGFDYGRDATTISGVTNHDGEFCATAPTVGCITYGADKSGYYGTVGKPYEYRGDPTNGRWQPWNPTLTVVLKKIINPVPMYAKRVNLGMPVFDKTVGFDLMEGDWVVPHGRGKVSDFVFLAELQKRSDEDYNYRLTLTFSNPADGIQSFDAVSRYGSELRSPHQAPDKGYGGKWVQVQIRKPGSAGENTRDENRNYVYRVRSNTDKNGNITGAVYGKIYGDFMNFVYYLNPDGTRNVEFDPKRNLFKNLNQDEEVRQP